jgi:intracellular sulfur oxidation DsrE/DsrF family protein
MKAAWRFHIMAICTALVAISAMTARADGVSTDSTEWVYPVISGYGGVHPGPNLPIHPEPGTEYKIIVDVVHPNPDPAKLSNSLDRLARLVNLMGYAGVPAEHVHVVAVLDEGAGLLALTNESYRSRFKVDNPNLALLHQLKLHGVELMICSQAMASNKLVERDFTADATVTLSALSDFVVFGQRGYSYMQL